MIKKNIRSCNVLDKLNDQERQFKKELAKTFLAYLDRLSPNKQIEQIELLLYDTQHKNLSTLERRLTPQERKCLYLAGKGKAIKEMARILDLSPRTIKFHRSNIIKKLEVPNLMAVVAIDNQSNTVNTNNDEKNFDLSFLNKLDFNVYLKDKNGHYLWCNKKLANICGLKNQKDIIGKNDFELISTKLAKAIVALDNTIIKEGKECRAEEIGIDAEKRKAIYFSIKTPVKEELGNMEGIVGVSIDITGRSNQKLRNRSF